MYSRAGGLPTNLSPFNGLPSLLSTTGRVYLLAPTGQSVNSANTNTLTNDQIRGTLFVLANPLTVTSLTFRTSSTNASVGAQVRLGLYNVDSNLSPTTFIGQTNAISITDSAVNTNFTSAITHGVINLSPGIYMAVVHSTATTTAARSAIQSVNGPTSIFGAANIADAVSNAFLTGWTGTQAWASGLPAVFPTPTAVAGIANSPAIFATV